MTLKEMVPWRWGGLRRWDDEERPFESFFREMDTLHKEMDRLFEDFWKVADVTPDDHAMAIDDDSVVVPKSCRGSMTEDEKAFHIQVELPGMDRKTSTSPCRTAC
jgi:HSP20 family molecular chaperone IbpA